jgi:hypothetical protein
LKQGESGREVHWIDADVREPDQVANSTVNGSIVAAFSGPVWLLTGSARAASTSGATGVGPGIMSSGVVVNEPPHAAI